MIMNTEYYSEQHADNVKISLFKSDLICIPHMKTDSCLESRRMHTDYAASYSINEHKSRPSSWNRFITKRMSLYFTLRLQQDEEAC
jgi:hypothetical protein